MKKHVFGLMLLVIAFCAFPNSVLAIEKPPINKTVKSDDIPEEIKVLINRLNEIKALDKSALNRLEKKELRKEVRTIKQKVRSTGNGIYISSGAIILILLLIIIL
ncbi:hypothetical protein [Algibacter luteus]|uniref:hypothetical protein n=1 Tax=Algibacter luteus TaxID=1178825 RepID=UPI00259306B6|nr:hypothetical protein [Algibacter luteus]WJJ97367.1 hypothetical protein O5O44_03075 [Algibacter luteus]